MSRQLLHATEAQNMHRLYPLSWGLSYREKIGE